MTDTRWFSRAGEDVTGQQFDEAQGKGRASYRWVPACPRCGGAGRAEKWRHTGMTCFQCGGSGRGAPRVSPCYTQARLATLNQIRDRRAAAQRSQAEERARIAAELRRAEFSEWAAQHCDILCDLEALRGASDFLHDAWQVVCSTQALTPVYLDAVVTALAREKARRERAASSMHLGTPGERFHGIRVACTACVELPSPPGWPSARRWLHVLETADGTVLKYIGSTAAVPGKGKEATLDFSVKGHSEYRGIRQTEITRPARSKS